MQNKQNLIIVIFFGCFIFTACWSSDSKNKPDRTNNKSSPSPTVAETNKNSIANSKNSETSNNQMPVTEIKNGGFTANLPGEFVQPTDAVGQKLLKEYGALFVARGGATPPKTVIFKSEAEVAAFQNGLQKSKESIGGFNVELQAAAMKNLQDAIAEAKQNNLNITPRGADSAKRDYAGTVEIWASRVNPGLTHWVGKGKLTEAEAAKIRALSPFAQVPEIFKLESSGMFFSKDLSKSIIFSVAPPGTSQHLSMLALDVSEHDNSKVRDVLAKHGWFQTVVSDLPHFTFLGVAENQLSGLGLKKVNDGGRAFWLPSL
ncbi:MAG: D-alanyl-D-alanine carboxypeptidase family protein [Pyrinomonadaceae bacterium]|nr:D-alanyl-D-alanine carboxypeptidase family protein [Pyrinomonadaceae bacterium]